MLGIRADLAGNLGKQCKLDEAIELAVRFATEDVQQIAKEVAEGKPRTRRVGESVLSRFLHINSKNVEFQERFPLIGTNSASTKKALDVLGLSDIWINFVAYRVGGFTSYAVEFHERVDDAPMNVPLDDQN